MEIDCNLTKRLWAPDCTHAKVWFGGQRAEPESGLRYNAEEKSFRKLKRPLLVFLPPLHSSISFQSLINHPVCVLIHLHPRLPSFLIASPPLQLHLSSISPCRSTLRLFIQKVHVDEP